MRTKMLMRRVTRATEVSEVMLGAKRLVNPCAASRGSRVTNCSNRRAVTSLMRCTPPTSTSTSQEAARFTFPAVELKLAQASFASDVVVIGSVAVNPRNG